MSESLSTNAILHYWLFLALCAVFVLQNAFVLKFETKKSVKWLRRLIPSWYFLNVALLFSGLVSVVLGAGFSPLVAFMCVAFVLLVGTQIWFFVRLKRLRFGKTSVQSFRKTSLIKALIDAAVLGVFFLF